jgi:sugar phosphate isomerase/epimerase
MAVKADESASGRPVSGPGHARGRLGIDQPAGWWPTTPRLKSYEAAGFGYVQVRMPPRAFLSEPELVVGHACALRERLRLIELRLILHAPDDLLAGSAEHDRQLLGALRYATLAGAELLVYHGARVLHGGGSEVRTRLDREAASLQRVLSALGPAGVQLAIENLAPVHPGPVYVCHDPAAVAALVRRLDCEQVGICLDIGHAHIVAGLVGRPLAELVAPALEHVILFHVHDNFGARLGPPRPGQLEPLRFDLHLPPGAGDVPWEAVAPWLARRQAPLQLEVHPAGRPEPATLGVLMREVLGLGTADAGDPVVAG